VTVFSSSEPSLSFSIRIIPMMSPPTHERVSICGYLSFMASVRRTSWSAFLSETIIRGRRILDLCSTDTC
jgi:hypothetical protein